MASTVSKSSKATTRSKASFLTGAAQALDMGATLAPQRQRLGYDSYCTSLRTHWTQTGRYMKSAMRHATNEARTKK